MTRIRPFRLVVLAGALSLLALSHARPGASRATFSRSRWIAEQRWARFDGGLERGENDDVRALREALRATPGRPRPTPAGPPNVRVSADVLDPDAASGAQSETEAEPQLAADPNDEAHLLAGYQEDRFADGGSRVLVAATTRDFGAHWSETIVPGLTRASGGPFERASDPWVAFAADGTVYFASLVFDETRPDNGIVVSRSDDGGETWNAPATIDLLRTNDFDDKQAIVVDNAADSPFFGRVYVVWDTARASQTQPLRFAHSDDRAITWSAPADLSTDGVNLGAIPLVGPGGAVFVVWQRFLPGSRVELRAARSDDGGASWSAPATIAEQRTRGVSQLRTGELPAAAIDPRNGRLYVVWQDDRFTPGTDQIVLASSPDGFAWSAPIRVSDGPDDRPSFTPAVAVNGQGRFGVAYATMRNDPQGRFLVDQYLVTTNSRGRLLGATRSSTRTFDVRDAAIARGFFLGDYQGLVAGRRSFRPVWVATSEASRLREGAQSDVVTLVIR